MILDVLMTSVRHQLIMMRGTFPFVALMGIIQPAVFLLIALPAVSQPGAERSTQVATAVLLTAFWNSTVWNGAGILRRERQDGTLAALMSAARDPQIVLTGKSLGASLFSVSLIATTVFALLAALGRLISPEHAVWFVIGLLATLATGTTLGMLLSCLFVLSRFGAQLSNAIMYPIYLLAGLMIPPPFIPTWLRWIRHLISLSWIQDFLASTIRGPVDLPSLMMSVLLSVGYAATSVIAFRRVSYLARGKGSLELV
jgi:ABC-2 type transport system permease protein